MVDQVERLGIEDGITGPMKAAEAQLRKTADAADVVEKSVTRMGTSIKTLVNRNDEATKASNTLERAMRELKNAQENGAAAVARGDVTQQQLSNTLETLSTKVRAARAAMDSSGDTATRYASAHNQAATAARALSVQIPDIVSGLATGQGVFQIAIQQGQQIAGSFQSAGISFRALGPAIASILSPLVSVGGAVAVGVAGLGALAYSAETTQREMLGLQATLRASRDDYAAMAAEAEKAARAVAASSGFGTGDARAAATSFAAQPAFQGSQAQLQNLVRTAGDLSVALGVTLPAAAEELARAISHPAEVADQLAKQFGGTIPQATVDMIKSLAAGGDNARAFAEIMGIVQGKTKGAAEASKTELQKALEDLGAAFVRTDGQGQSFVQTLGTGIANAAATAVSALATVVRGIEGMWEAATNTGKGGVIPGASTGSVNPVVITPDNRLPQDVSNEIYRIAEQRNFAGNASVSALQADFATRLTYQESRGQQFAKGGGVLTSPAGALGTMQVMPGNAGGNDLTTQSGNITAGLKVINDLWAKYDGNPGLVAMAYNWGPARVDALLEGIKTTGQVGSIPEETEKFVQNITGSGYRSFLPGGANVNSGTLSGGGTWDSTGGANTGVVNDPRVIINEALQRAGNTTPTGTAQTASDDIKLYTKALADLAEQGDTSSASVAKLREALQTAQVSFYNAIGPAEKLVRATDLQIKSELSVADAWKNGAAAADHATNVIKAQSDALAFADPRTKQYAETVTVLVDRYDALSRARQETAAGSALFDQGQQLEYLQVEAQTIGLSEDARNRTLAAEKERQAIAKTMPGILDEEKERLIANAAAMADAATAIERQRRAIDELGNIASNIFSQLQNAITNAFVSGSGAAVNFGNIAKGAISAVVAEAVKLAIINPLMNSAFGGSRTTLSDIGGVLGKVVGGGSSGSGFDFGTLSNLYSLGKGAYGAFTGGTGTVSPFLDSVGAYVAPELFNSLPASSAAYAALPAGEAGPVAIQGALGTTFSSAASGVIGGAGAGFAAGSLVGGAVQGSLGKVGPAPQIGAGVGATGGALAGAYAGTVIFPGIGTAVGALIGGLLGGTLGGGGGGLIGPKAPSSFSSIGLSIDSDGYLKTGKEVVQKDEGAKALFDATHEGVTALNQFFSEAGLRVASLGGITQLGSGAGDPSKAQSLGNAFGGFRFDANNEVLDRALNDRAFDNAGDLQNVVSDILNFVKTTVPALEALKTQVNNGTATTALETLNSQFSAAIEKAKGLGIATEDLSTAWNDATGAVMKQVNAQTRVMDENLTLRFASARASNTGSSADAMGAQLLAFDTQAAHERESLTDTLKGIWGDAFTSASAYADQMALLEKTLGEERLSIQKQYNDRISANASTTVSSLADYASGLGTSSASPLSPMAQYTQAAQQFGGVSRLAAEGDYSALSNITSSADTFLSLSRTVNGGGAGYASDYRRVLDALDKASLLTTDTLTASVLQAETRTQTQVLQTELKRLRDEVVALRQQVAQTDSRPR